MSCSIGYICLLCSLLVRDIRVNSTFISTDTGSITENQSPHDELRQGSIRTGPRMYETLVSDESKVANGREIHISCDVATSGVVGQSSDHQYEKHDDAPSRHKRFLINYYEDGDPYAWKQTDLTWGITVPSRQISPRKQRDVIRRAIDTWSKEINFYHTLRFREERGSAEPDINIKFVRGRHGPKEDPVFSNRDKTNNKLGHAWGPYHDAMGLSGDLHFDDEDDWTDDKFLYGVALHELGHVMGLQHSSSDTQAVMFPAYLGLQELGRDDRDGVHALYGNGKPRRYEPRPLVTTPRPATRATAPRYTVPPTPAPTPADVCGTSRIHVFEDPSTKHIQFFFVVQEDRVHRIGTGGHVFTSAMLEDMFPGAPINADVIFSDHSHSSVSFIKAGRLWKYKNYVLVPGHPKYLMRSQLPETPKFGISLHDMDTSRTEHLLFGERRWWRFSASGSGSSRPNDVRDFHLGHVPRDADFAIRWADGKIYAGTSQGYTILRNKDRQTFKGRPEWLKPLCLNINSKAAITISRDTLLLSILATILYLVSST